MGFLDGSLGHRRVVKVPELAGDFWPPTLFFFSEKVNLGRKSMDI